MHIKIKANNIKCRYQTKDEQNKTQVRIVNLQFLWVATTSSHLQRTGQIIQLLNKQTSVKPTSIKTEDTMRGAAVQLVNIFCYISTVRVDRQRRMKGSLTWPLIWPLTWSLTWPLIWPLTWPIMELDVSVSQNKNKNYKYM